MTQSELVSYNLILIVNSAFILN